MILRAQVCGFNSIFAQYMCVHTSVHVPVTTARRGEWKLTTCYAVTSATRTAFRIASCSRRRCLLTPQERSTFTGALYIHVHRVLWARSTYNYMYMYMYICRCTYCLCDIPFRAGMTILRWNIQISPANYLARLHVEITCDRPPYMVMRNHSISQNPIINMCLITVYLLQLPCRHIQNANSLSNGFWLEFSPPIHGGKNKTLVFFSFLGDPMLPREHVFARGVRHLDLI